MRHQSMIRLAVFTSLFVVVLITLYWNTAIYRDFNAELRRKLLFYAETSAPLTTPPPPVERTNIFFLKAHKCASSTVQNILMRFGYDRELDFVLPRNNNYIGSPKPFHVDMIDKELSSLNGKYNIFTHHTRYDQEQMKSAMYDDSAFVTILREPADVFESIYAYYKFNKTFNLQLQDLLQTPSNINKINRRYLNRIGVNQMSFDLGMPVEDFNSEEKVREFVRKIDSEFDLVMISEYMEASLVLLCDLMNWPIENVVSLKLNSRPDSSKYKLTDADRKVLIDFNRADNELYNHFLNKFRDKVNAYGEEKMKQNICKLLNYNEKFSYRCVIGMNTKGYGHTTAYQLRRTDDWMCFYAARSELAFTNELRTFQKKKMKVLNKLYEFMSNVSEGRLQFQLQRSS